MLRRITPKTIHPPFANYCHATEVSAGARWLVLSGQLGVRPDGTVPDSVREQAAVCFENLRAILAEGGIGMDALVRLTTYLIDPEDLADYMAVRDDYVVAPPPASTLLVVQALSRPQFRIEIEAIAATYR